MAAIDDLIEQINDPTLRERLRRETDRIIKEKKFGLVFENHLPELAPIYSATISKGNMVAQRKKSLSDLWHVIDVTDETAYCSNRNSGEKKRIPIGELVVVRQFGHRSFHHSCSWIGFRTALMMLPGIS